MQAGWAIAPTVIVTKQKIRYSLGELDVQNVFHENTPQEALLRIKQWVDSQLKTMAAKQADYHRFEVSTIMDDWSNTSINGITLVAIRLETDEEVEKRKKKALELLADTEAKQQLEFKRLSLIYGKEHT